MLVSEVGYIARHVWDVPLAVPLLELPYVGVSYHVGSCLMFKLTLPWPVDALHQLFPPANHWLGQTRSVVFLSSSFWSGPRGKNTDNLRNRIRVNCVFCIYTYLCLASVGQ